MMMQRFMVIGIIVVICQDDTLLLKKLTITLHFKLLERKEEDKK